MNQFSHKADLFNLMFLLLNAPVLQFSPFASFISLLLLTSPCCNAFNIKDGLHSHVLFKFIMSDLFKYKKCIINFHYKFRILPLFLPLQAFFGFQQLSCFIWYSLKISVVFSNFTSHTTWLFGTHSQYTSAQNPMQESLVKEWGFGSLLKKQTVLMWLEKQLAKQPQCASSSQ